MVGAVLVRGGKIIATGFHRIAGADHAEIVALKRAGAKAKGSTLYINLEPCSHYGRTPPCSRALIHAGIKEVVAGMKDPNPLVGGKGFRGSNGQGSKSGSGFWNKSVGRLTRPSSNISRGGSPSLPSS